MDISITESPIYHINMNSTSENNQYGQICGILMLILCIFGFFANLFSLFLFTRRPMRSSINVLLAGLSAIDATVLLFAIPTFVMPAIVQIDGLELISLFGLYQISMMAQTCSIWTFVLISLERYLAVVHPLKVQRYLTIKRARIAQLSVAGASIVYNMVRFWEYEMAEPPDEFKRRLRGDQVYFAAYYTTLFLLTHFLGPFLLIAILNVFILLAIRKAQDQRTKLTYRQTQQRKTTQMIVVVTAVFAVCNTLPFILNIWEAFVPTLFNDGNPMQTTAYLILEISNMLVVVNSSTTVCIYLIYCRKYRVLFLFYAMRHFAKLAPTTVERLRENSFVLTPNVSNANMPAKENNKISGGFLHPDMAKGYRRVSNSISADSPRLKNSSRRQRSSYVTTTTVIDAHSCDV